MSIEEIKLQLKFTALNSIRKIYDKHNFDKGIGLRSNDWNESWSEQRDEKVKQIIDNLEKELLNLKNKK